MNARAELLADAEKAVNGDRNNTYGPPTQDFARTADAATAMGFRLVREEGEELVIDELEPHHVAMLLGLVKLSRLVWSPDRRDSWLDLAGYAACGWDCASEEQPAEQIIEARPGRASFGFVPEDIR